MKEQQKVSLDVVNPNAAGIDIGSRSHWVAVGQNAEDIKEFGVYSEDQQAMCDWLKEKGVTSIAMESTGTYSRHRQNILKQAANGVKRMQKYLRLMNMRLDVVVNDIVGLTGSGIIEAFINGQTQGKELAKLRHYNCKKSEEEIGKALQYNGRKDYLFALKQEWVSYRHIQQQIKETDEQIRTLLGNIIDKDDNKKQHVAEKKSTSEKTKTASTI